MGTLLAEWNEIPYVTVASTVQLGLTDKSQEIFTF